MEKERDLMNDPNVALLWEEKIETFLAQTLLDFGVDLKPFIPFKPTSVVTVDHNGGWSIFVFTSENGNCHVITLQQGIPWNNFYEIEKFKALDTTQLNPQEGR
jgi:hypothetical protein